MRGTSGHPGFGGREEKEKKRGACTVLACLKCTFLAWFRKLGVIVGLEKRVVVRLKVWLIALGCENLS